MLQDTPVQRLKGGYSTTGLPSGRPVTRPREVQYGLVVRRDYVLEYLVVNRIVVKRVLFKWFKLRWVHGPKKLVK